MVVITPPPQIFVREDLSKPENRVNLALFNVMTISVIREWFLKALKFPQNSIIYPPENVGGIRPDFVVVGPDDTVVGWIEVELGVEDMAQIKNYRVSLNEPVKSLVGLDESGGDLSLETIAREINRTLSDVLNRQQAMCVQVLTKLIASLARKSESIEYTDPIEDIRNQPLLKELQRGLGPILNFGSPPIGRGTALVSTITQRGWTLRVFSKAARMGSVSVFWAQTIGTNQVRFPSYDRLARCLPTELVSVEEYTDLLLELGCNIKALSEKQNLAVEESSIITNIDRFTPIIKKFAAAYGSGRNQGV